MLRVKLVELLWGEGAGFLGRIVGCGLNYWKDGAFLLFDFF